MKLPSLSIVLAVVASSPAVSAEDDPSIRGLRRDRKPNPGRGPPPQSEVPVVDLSGTGEDLIQPTPLRSTGNALKATLRMGVLEYQGPAYTTKIRAYNGNLPGPVFRVKPGDTLHIQLVNDLDGPTGNLANNEFQHPNQTNVHTHGPHISGEDPGDNVFIKIDESVFPGYSHVADGKNVGPKEFHTYRYKIDGNHMPGTMWYHPHLHGSTAIQASTASGLLIVDDPEDYPLPQIIKDMPEVLMNIYDLDIGSGQSGVPGSLESGGLREWSTEAGDQVSNWTVGEGLVITDANFNGGDFPKNTDVFLPNFQYQPVVKMLENKWYRFRMVQSVTEASIVFGPNDSSNCDMMLLAKDGVYIKNSGVYGPREIPAVFLSPGNRADVAIRCSDDEEVLVLAKGRPSSDVAVGGDFDPELSPDPDKPTLFSIRVQSNTDDPDDDLPESYDLPTPCYLVDTQGLTGGDIDGTTPIFYEGRVQPMGLVTQEALSANPPYGAVPDPAFVQPWVNDMTPYLNFDLGTVQDIELLTAGVHPHHQHVNPFQLIDLENVWGYGIMSDATQIYFQNGDWHDLFQWPLGFTNGPNTVPVGPPGCVCSDSCAGDQACLDNCMDGKCATPGPTISVKIRFPVNQFAGRMVFHCHRLNHEDLGMIGFFQVDGEEGTLWDGARDVDEQCLLPKLPGNGNGKGNGPI